MTKLRDLTQHNTCDWGHCDNPAVAERHDPEHGWLPVCEQHTGPKPPRRTPGRATCPHCGGEYALKANGRFRLHSVQFRRCPGSNTTAEVA